MKSVNFDHQKNNDKPANFGPFRARLHEIIFESDTPAGKFFDVMLLMMILLSIVVLMLETVPSLQGKWKDTFLFLEWAITIFFTIEYLLRLYCVYKPIRYATSFFGLIDIVSILPMYLDFLIPGAHSLLIVRSLRLMRVFRIFKLDMFLNQGNQIVTALQASRAKIYVFLFFVLLVVCIFGSLMYVIESPTNPGFDSIPAAIYWAIVTITTVGYGDISPITGLGKFIASVIMVLGYAVIAVPTGIVTSAMMQQTGKSSSQTCLNCGREGHSADAEYCKYCGVHLDG
jgi:voltage-gated potassium channel